jgi:apolipoprotein N-acyltransferase
MVTLQTLRNSRFNPLRALPWNLAAWALTAAVAFHAAYAWPSAWWLLLVYLFALLRLALAPTWRQAFYSGLGAGLLIAAGRLDFFWQIFSGGALGLWLVFAFWIGLFAALSRLCLRRFGERLGWLCLPGLWCGLEYFRSELYYLRFSWLSPGYGVAGTPCQGLDHLAGAYGLGLLIAAIACAGAWAWNRSRLRAGLALLAGAAALWLMGACLPRTLAPVSNRIRVAGIQMEFPSESEVMARLNQTLKAHPETDLFVLSEYTLADQVPGRMKDWCRKQRRYLIVGGKEPAGRGNFYNTAYVVGPTGAVEFAQAKAVPIQFFKDGLPARGQKLWDSPWGRIGLCICYDLSYRRVVDNLVKLGAQGLIVPTMDVTDWGVRQHELHARVAPTRAAEYGIPIFRLASSGISQCVDARGRTLAAAPCPGDGAVLTGILELRAPGRLPLDHWLAPFAAWFTGLCLLFCLKPGLTRRTVQT